MLQVPQQQYIKFLYENEGWSVSDIARHMGIDWRTANKYASRDDWNEVISKRKKSHPVMGPYIDIVDTWLLEDERIPRKQRHTSKRIFDRLQEEYGFEGGRRTVEEYVAKRRAELKLEHARSFERLEHPGGEAQVDFGTAYVGSDGQLTERKVLTMSFPYSNAAFVFPVQKENTESFLEALKRIFERIGGVPTKIWFDNLSAAVVSMSRDGGRKFTDQFLNFSAHYRFIPEFCNPYSGNEKGHVEGKVGYGRRNWLVPPPVVESDAELEKLLSDQAAKDMDRLHYAKNERIADLWANEQQKLLVLPTTPFDVYRLVQAKVNKYKEIRFEKADIPLPQCKAGDVVWLKVRWNEIDVLSGDGAYEHVATIPRPYTDKVIPIDWTAVFSDYMRRPKAVMYSHFVKMMPLPVQSFIRVSDNLARKARIQLMCRLLETYSLEDIGLAIDNLPADHEHPDTAIMHTLYAMKHPISKLAPFAESHTPKEIYGHTADLNEYDLLLGVRTQ